MNIINRKWGQSESYLSVLIPGFCGLIVSVFCRLLSCCGWDFGVAVGEISSKFARNSAGTKVFREISVIDR